MENLGRGLSRDVKQRIFSCHREERLRELGLCGPAKRRLKRIYDSGLQLLEGNLQSGARVFLAMIIDYNEG